MSSPDKDLFSVARKEIFTACSQVEGQSHGLAPLRVSLVSVAGGLLGKTAEPWDPPLSNAAFPPTI